MAREKTNKDVAFERARDELWSHILSCGVLEAAQEHQKEWFDDTMEYIADRYELLSNAELNKLRTLGERFCQPVIKNAQDAVATTS